MRKRILLTTLFAILAFFTVTACTSKVEAATPVNITSGGTSTTITRDIDGVTNNVDGVTFTYTITADSSNPTGGCNGAPATATVSFSNVAPTAGTTTATATGTIDFSGTTFSELGTYKFRVTETNSSNSTVFPVDSTNSYDIIVQVTNELDDTTNQPTGNLIATKVAQAEKYVSGTKQDGKSDVEFESDANFTKVQISKTVTGDLADSTEYFEFKVTVPGLNNNETYTVKGGSYASNPTTCTAGQEFTVRLKGGETITIGENADGLKQIASGSGQARVAEQEATTYKTYTTIGSGTEEENSTKVIAEQNISATDADNVFAFRNDKQSETLTGIFIDIAPYIALIALAVVGLVIIKKNSIR